MSSEELVILLPVFKNTSSLKECVGSILTQSFSSFELIILDKSEDGCVQKIMSCYADNRVTIADDETFLYDVINPKVTINTFLLADCNKFFLPDSLIKIYNFILLYPRAKALLIESFKKNENIENDILQSDISAYDLLDDEVLLKSVLLFNGLNITELDFVFKNEEEYYVGKLESLCRLLISNEEIKKIESYVFNQDSCCLQLLDNNKYFQQKKELFKWLRVREEFVKNDIIPAPISDNQLTVCISFLNEGEEVVNTVRSIRETVGYTVDVVVVNDASTDGYDYEAKLSPFKVHYSVNKYRIGSSAGKDKAVQICSTPYFILLDAHMRFYESNWASIVVEELQRRPFQLLCCQSKALTKNEDGNIVDNGLMGVHGAYLEFNDNDYIPKIRWNGHLLSNKLKENEIPVVLGATYCSSKQYWDKIRGFQGLCQYGAEEEYISVKAWLEGGGCKFMPDIIIGHIYRKTSPYKTHSLQMLYNRFVMTSTLFPRPEHMYASVVAKKINFTAYKSVSFFLNQDNDYLQELKAYYNRFFNGHDFCFIKQINKPLEKSLKQLILSEEDRLKRIVEEICDESKRIESMSLFNGRIGQILILALYAKAFKDVDMDEAASDIFSQFLEDLPVSDLPYGFYNGYAGIGWVLLYLSHHGMIGDSLEQELNYIDARLTELNPFKIRDYSLCSGFGGIVAYIVERCFSKQVGSYTFEKEYLDCVLSVCKQIISNPDMQDMRTVWYSLLFICYYTKQDTYKPCITIESVISLPHFLPKESCFQKNDMTGKYGYALYLIMLSLETQNYHSIN